MPESVLTVNLIRHLDVVIKKVKGKKIEESINISSLTGVMSKEIFLAHLSRYKSELKVELEKIIREDINIIFEYIEKNKVHFSNVDGLSGFGWGLAHLCKYGFLNENELFEELDEFLFHQAILNLENLNYDFFYGGIGHGNYFLERLSSNPKLHEYLNQIINKLYLIGKQKKGSLIWQTKENVSEKTIDLSLSHGLSSIIVFLAKLVQAGIAKEFCSELLAKCCHYLLLNSHQSKQGLRFPDCVCESKPIFSPLRWCHGQLGVVYALAFAGNVLNDPLFLSKALESALNIATIKMSKKELLYSATVCHGTLGIAHTFKRLNDILRDDQLEKASIYWYRQSIKLMDSEIGYCYFDDDQKYRELSGVLLGVEGIGLTILSNLCPTDPKWDSCILLH